MEFERGYYLKRDRIKSVDCSVLIPSNTQKSKAQTEMAVSLANNCFRNETEVLAEREKKDQIYIVLL